MPNDDVILNSATFSAEAEGTLNRKLFGRYVKLVVADAFGKGIDLSNLQIQFTVTSRIVQTMPSLNIRIWNLNEDTANAITNEYFSINLSAGYQQFNGLIFTGLVTQAKKGREGANNGYLDITAMEMDMSYNFSIMNQTLPAGWSQVDVFNAIVNRFNADGVSTITAGQAPATAGKSNRPKIMYGATKDFARSQAQTTSSNFFVHSGQLYMLPLDQVTGIAHDAVILNSESGLVGVPEQTIDGLIAKSLLRYDLLPGRIIQVGRENINTIDIKSPGNVYGNPLVVPGVSQNNQYKVLAIKHYGDTRSQDWYTDIVARPLDPANGVAVVPGSQYQDFNPSAPVINN